MDVIILKRKGEKRKEMRIRLTNEIGRGKWYQDEDGELEEERREERLRCGMVRKEKK